MDKEKEKHDESFSPLFPDTLKKHDSCQPNQLQSDQPNLQRVKSGSQKSASAKYHAGAAEENAFHNEPPPEEEPPQRCSFFSCCREQDKELYEEQKRLRERKVLEHLGSKLERRIGRINQLWDLAREKIKASLVVSKMKKPEPSRVTPAQTFAFDGTVVITAENTEQSEDDEPAVE